MVIKNFQQLATSSLRKQALYIAEAAFACADVKNIIGKNLSYNPKKEKLKIKSREFNLDKFNRVFCLGLGQGSKAALDEIKVALKGKKILDIDLSQNSPMPEIFKDDLVICVIFDEGRQYKLPVLYALKRSGAADLEISIVSKRLEKFQGGNLAKILYPATCLSLIFSGKNNDISIIEGGPTEKDAATNIQAQAILKKYNILEGLNLNSLTLRETPKEDKYFKNIYNILMLSPESFLQAAREKAEDLGFKSLILKSDNQDFPEVIASTKKEECLLSLVNSDKAIFDVLPILKDHEALIYLSGNSGIIADGSTLSRAKALGLTSDKGMNYFFENLGNNIETEQGIELAVFFIFLKS